MELHQPTQQITDAQQALRLLREGNARYLANRLSDKSAYADERKALSGGQFPFAVVLCCSDSRVAPEIFFDQQLGDLFVIRNAGNVVDDVVLASVEYAVEGLHCPLVVVCGHSSCGAVTAACHGGHSLPHLESILERIHPAITEGAEVNDVSRTNVQNAVKEISENEIVREMGCVVMGAYYDICSGEVSWL